MWSFCVESTAILESGQREACRYLQIAPLHTCRKLTSSLLFCMINRSNDCLLVESAVGKRKLCDACTCAGHREFGCESTTTSTVFEQSIVRKCNSRCRFEPKLRNPAKECSHVRIADCAVRPWLRATQGRTEDRTSFDWRSSFPT